MQSKRYGINTIGLVKSEFKGDTGMPFRGVGARLKIHPRYKAALDGIEKYKFLWVMCFLHNAERKVLKAIPKKWKRKGIMKERGVFSMRAPCRPNPISISLVKLKKVKGLTLFVEKLDVYTGTPVIDIKPFVTEYDSCRHISKEDNK